MLNSPEKISTPNVSIAIETDPESHGWREGSRLEAGVFQEKGYIEDERELEIEYEKYMPRTEFVSVEVNGRIQGSARFIYFSDLIGFKTLDDIISGRLKVTKEGHELLTGIDLSRTFEVGTLAAAPQARSIPEDEGRVAVALYGAIYGETQRHDCEHILASFDEEYFLKFKGIFGAGAKELGPSTDYMGSPTVPVVMEAYTLLDHIHKVFPLMYNAVVEHAAALSHA